MPSPSCTAWLVHRWPHALGTGRAVASLACAWGASPAAAVAFARASTLAPNGAAESASRGVLAVAASGVLVVEPSAAPAPSRASLVAVRSDPGGAGLCVLALSLRAVVLAEVFPVEWYGLEVTSSDPVALAAWAHRGVAVAGASASGLVVPPC